MPRLSTLASALALALAGTSAAQAQSFSNVISFGDSLSDAGQYAALGPYSFGAGSFTTNPDDVWTQILSNAYGYNQTASMAGGTDYAWGGAPTSFSVGGVSVPLQCVPSTLPCKSVAQQIGAYLTANGGHADGDALYTYWAGANDIFNYLGYAGAGYITSAQAQAFTGASAITAVGEVGALQAAGANYIVVLNLPDIGKSPFGTSLGAAGSAGVSGLVFVYNETLNAGLATLADGIIPINAYALVNEVLADPATYGFTNTTGTACTVSSLFCTPATYVSAGANETYLFADGVHPTGGAHRLIAHAVMATLAAPGQVSFAGELPLQVYDTHSGTINNELFNERRTDRSNNEANAYARIQYGKQKFDTAANTGAMDFNQITATFGADYMASDNVTLGAAASFGGANSSTGGANLRSRELLASVYASLNVGEAGYIDAIVSGGGSNIDIKRSIVLGPSTRIERGTTNARHLGFELGGGLAFGSEDFHHGPFVSIAWQKVNVDGYAEDGLDSTSMWFGDFERKSLVGRIGYQLQGNSGSFKPFARIAYAHEDKSDPTRVQAGSNTLNGHFTMNGFTPSDHWGEAELGFRYSANDNTDLLFSYSGRFSDDTQNRGALSFAVMTQFGKAAPAPVPEAEPMPEPQKTCADMDDDGDGVNNCDDKCTDSAAGQAIGPDGCPVPLTIDLKGVNFDFDKATLRPDAVAILDEAISILGKYPELKVAVAGHTDSVGDEAYNQGLSERRARTVYDYLTGHGIGAARLVGPQGFGESKPIDSNDTKEGRARNRRTELDVQN
jgi:outer membrane lipase/esterase